MEQKLKQNIIDAVKEYYDHIASKKQSFAYIPPSGKVVDQDDLLYMMEASLDMWLTAGKFNDQFEQNLAHYLGVRYTLSVNSGSSANLLALSALTSHRLGDRKLIQGDEVITVAVGFPTTINPIIQNGLIPVFIDSERSTHNIDAKQIEKAITTKTKAIMIAHTLGTPFDLHAIQTLCEQYNLWLIEDSCDALGAEYQGKKLGSIGHIGTYSFYPAHHITMGEGGAIATNDHTLYTILMSFRDWGRDCWCPAGRDNTCGRRFALQRGNLPFGYDHKYTYSHIGYNCKITDWQAAIGCAQLKKLPHFIEKRTSNAQYLLSVLEDLQEYLVLPTIPHNSKPSWFGFILSVKEEAPFTKQALVEYLEQNAIGTRQLFAGNILRQPMMVENTIPLRIANSELLYSSALTEEQYALLPNTEYSMNNTFWVGTYPALGKEELDRISNVIHTFIKKNIS